VVSEGTKIDPHAEAGLIGFGFQGLDVVANTLIRSAVRPWLNAVDVDAGLWTPRRSLASLWLRGSGWQSDAQYRVFGLRIIHLIREDGPQRPDCVAGHVGTALSEVPVLSGPPIKSEVSWYSSDFAQRQGKRQGNRSQRESGRCRPNRGTGRPRCFPPADATRRQFDYVLRSRRRFSARLASSS